MPTDKSRISRKRMAQVQNNQEFINMFQNYFTMALDQFAYDGLPETCDERFIERSMLLYGQAMLARYEGAIISPAAANGANLNLYGYPIKGWGWGLNGFNHEFRLFVPGADDSDVTTKAASGLELVDQYRDIEAVIGYDNPDRYPYVAYIFNAARRLADLMRSCDVAVQNLKAPYIISADETQKSSVEEAFRRRDENVGAMIFSKLTLNPDNFHVWPVNIDYNTLTAFWQQFRNIEGQLLEILGIDSNADTDKRERLLVDEVNANNERISANFVKRLHQRELWCERANKVLGTNISVHPRKEDYHEQAADLSGVEDYQSHSADFPGGDRRSNAGGAD